MHADRIKARILGSFLGFFAAFSSISALADGMRMDNVPLLTLAAVFVLGAVLFGITLGMRGFPAVPAIFGAAILWFWLRGSLGQSVEGLVYRCSVLYDMGYGTGVIRWSTTPEADLNPTLILSLLGLGIVLLVSWSVARGKSAWSAAAVTFFPLVPCLLLTDTVPKPIFLYLQLLTIALLLFTGTVRKRSLSQGNALTVLALLPLAIALGALFLCMPKESYTGDAAVQKLEDWVVSLFENTQQPEETGNPLPQLPSQPTRDQVNLNTVGPQLKWEIPVLVVTSSQSGPLYLRERGYDTYAENRWEADKNEGELQFFTSNSDQQTAHIRTMRVHDYLYLPYGTQWLDTPAVSAQSPFRGSIQNTDNRKEYTAGYTSVDLTNSRLHQIHKTVGGQQITILDGQIFGTVTPPARYLALEESTRIRAQAILERELPNLNEMSALKQAQAICSYVQNTATYSLSTPRMPQDADFALWFLEESDTGYCVHFATAAAVLLRAAGIPSRYVTGYLADAQADQSVTVMEKSAHAWVEVNIGGFWIMLEPTPADGVEETLGTQPSQSTEPSGEEDTTPSTMPDATTLPPIPPGDNPSNPATQPQNPDTSSPIGGAEGPSIPKEPFRLPLWAKVLLWLAAAVAAVIGQWKLRVFLGRKRRYSGSSNAQALACWQHVQRYAKLLGRETDPQLYQLALKAKFSQHRLTKEELHTFRTALDAARRETQTRQLRIRLLATVILALH